MIRTKLTNKNLYIFSKITTITYKVRSQHHEFCNPCLVTTETPPENDSCTNSTSYISQAKTRSANAFLNRLQMTTTIKVNTLINNVLTYVDDK